MKKKKNGRRTFLSIILSDIKQIFYILFVGLPKAIVHEVRSLDWYALKVSMNDEDNISGWMLVLIVFFVATFLGLAFLLSEAVKLSEATALPLSCILPLLFVYVVVRFVWYKAAIIEEERMTDLRNIAQGVVDLDDLTPEQQEDFYNTVSGSGG